MKKKKSILLNLPPGVKVPTSVWFSFFANTKEALNIWHSQHYPRDRFLDPCQWADAKIGRAMQFTVNLEWGSE